MAKNKGLMFVFAITGVIALALIYLNAQVFIGILNDIDQITENGEEITEIRESGSPSPGTFEEYYEDYCKLNEGKKGASREAALARWQNLRRDTRSVPENAERIEAEAEALKAETRELRRFYGHPYDSAFGIFLDNLKINQQPDDEIQQLVTRNMEKWNSIDAVRKAFLNVRKTVAKKNNLSISEQRTLFRNLKAEILKPQRKIAPEMQEAYAKAAEKRFDTAFNEFKKELEKLTLEPVLNTSSDFAVAEALFMQVLGLPRTIDADFGSYYKRFRDAVKSWDNKRLFPEGDIKGGTLCRVLEVYGRPKNREDEDYSVTDASIEPAFRTYQIYEDMFMRMRDSGIARLSDLKSDSSARDGKDEKNGCRSYTFTVEVIGTLDSIRLFVNSLHNAYKDHRVYTIVPDERGTLINITAFDERGAKSAAAKRDSDVKVPDEVSRALDKLAKLKESLMPKAAVAEDETDENAEDTEVVEETADTEAAVVPEAAPEVKDITKSEEYGMALIGRNELVKARFNVQYLIYEESSK